MMVGMPTVPAMIMPSMMFLIFIFTVLIGSLIGPLSASFAIAKMNRQEMAVLLREND